IEAKNFRLMRTPIRATEKSNWQEVIAHRAEVFIEDIELFKNHIVIAERKNGLPQLQVRNLKNEDSHYIEFNDPAYLVDFHVNVEVDTELLRFSYTSLTTPQSIYDYNLNTKESVLLKRQEVL